MTLAMAGRAPVSRSGLPLTSFCRHIDHLPGWAMIPEEVTRLQRILMTAVELQETAVSVALLDRVFRFEGRSDGGTGLWTSWRGLTRVVSVEVNGRPVPSVGATVMELDGRTRIALERPVVSGTPVTLAVRAGRADWDALEAREQYAVLERAAWLESGNHWRRRDLGACTLSVTHTPALRLGGPRSFG